MPAILICDRANAQQTGDATALEEIVVTARKTSENVQDVPLTVNVINSARLESAGVTNSAEIRNLVSNLYWDDNGGGTTENRITLRGINSNASRQGFDPGVGVYVDDVYVADTTGFNSALLDVERVEVLKGPQGTLFGRNTTAGAISLHTRRPSTTEFYTEVDARLGNYNLAEGRFVTNAPLGEQVALKVSGIYRDRDGYQRNVANGKRELNDETFYGGRTQLLWTPSADAELVFTADYFENDDLQNVPICFGGLACGFNPMFDSVFDDVAGDDGGSYTRRKLWSASLNGSWSTSGGYEWTSITSYQSREYHNDQDQDYTPTEFIRSGYHLPQDWQVSQELRVSTPRNERLRAIAGLYYFFEDRSINIPQVIGSAMAPLLGLPPATPRLVTTTDSTTQTTSWAIFGQAAYDFTPKLIGELGVRYTMDSKEFAYAQRVRSGIEGWPLAVRGRFGLLDPADPLAPGSGGVGPLEASDDWDKLTGLASLTWRPIDDVSVYVRYSQGYKSGGFQSTTVASHLVDGLPFVDSNPHVSFDPENMDAWELGLKSELFERRLRLNVAAFYMDYTDIQLQYIDPLTRAKQVLNAGDASSRGVELEISAAVSEGFTLDASVGLLKAELDAISVTIPGLNPGDELPYSPDVNASLTATYLHELTNGWRLVLSSTGNYRAEMWLDLTNTPAGPGVPVSFLSPETTLWNAQIGVETPGDWGVYLWGANLTDEREITGSIRAPLPFFAQAFTLNPPRTYGLELRARF